MATPDLNGTHTIPYLSNLHLVEPITNDNIKIEISKELLTELRNNADNGAEANDTADHITRFLKIINLVKIQNVNTEQLCVLAFPYSLTGKARRWWMHKGNDKITSWVELVDKFFYKYYPLSYASKTNDANEKGYDNTTLIDNDESSDDECDNDTNQFFDTYWNPDVDLPKEDVGNVLVWVKLYIVSVTTFSEDGLSTIATKLGTLLMLDSYTSDICLQSWGKSSYARVMIELQAGMKLKDNIVVAMPKIIGEGYYTCTIRIEYEWKPPSTGNTPIIDKIKKFEYLLIDGQAILVDEAGNPLKKVECLSNYDSEDEVASVDNDMACSLALERVYNWETATYDKTWYDEDVHYLRNFEKEFPSIVYNDALASKSDFSTEPTVSPQHVDEVNFKNETSLSEYDGEEQNVIYFNDLFHFNVIYADDLKPNEDNDNDKTDIE
nr:hypothetical protein [Tanacetum cinerariifolium]